MLGDSTDSPRTPRVGCVYLPQFPPEVLAETARAADDAGLDELWVWEDCFLSGGISAAAIALSHSRSLTVGIGVVPVPMRNVAVTAMEIATLARAFPGRVRVGVGHGVQDWMAQIGEKVQSPMTLLREHLSCLRALLDGERITYHGRYVHLDDVQLDWPSSGSTELLAGAVGPKTLALSGELASGTVITQGTTPHALRSALEHIAAGLSSRENPQPHSIVTYLFCATGPHARDELLAEYQRWPIDADSDVGVWGGAEDIAVGAQRWIEAGTDTLVLQPPVGADIVDFVGFVGRDVQPLIKAYAAEPTPPAG